MKKLFCLAALCALIFASCQKEERVNLNCDVHKAGNLTFTGEVVEKAGKINFLLNDGKAVEMTASTYKDGKVLLYFEKSGGTKRNAAVSPDGKSIGYVTSDGMSEYHFNVKIAD